MLSLRDISADTFPTPWSKQTFREGFIAMIAIALCLVLGQVTGHRAAGAIAAGGAFSIGFAVFHPTLSSPVLSMICATLGMASATLAGSLAAPWTPAVLIVVAFAAMNYGVISSLGPSAGWLAQQSAVFLIVSTYFANGTHYAVGRAAMVLLGGALQITIHLLFRVRWNVHHGAPLWKIVAARVRYDGRELHRQASWNSESVSFAGRLIVTMIVATALYRHLHLRNGYWIPMTALLVLKQQWTGTVSRSLARIVGTIGGAAIAFGLAHLTSLPHWFVGVMVVVFALCCFALQAVNYALFSVVTTLYIVFLFRFGGFSETAAAHIRLLNTVIGGALALAIDFLWYLLVRPLRQRERQGL
ncbi:FUSC family protein [Granulicella cerasi]|uniref:FUSC family protein n=1 Tax=Granulicella cerasi TaxID=741063 RepID=A0ABW1ZAT5_9BACT|nr:FUSC family protein [Granulicella cerasi]